MTPDDHAAAADDLLAPLDRRALAGNSLAEGDRTRAAVAHALLSLRAPQPVEPTGGVTECGPVRLDHADQVDTGRGRYGAGLPPVAWYLIEGQLVYGVKGLAPLAVLAVTATQGAGDSEVAQLAYNDLAALVDTEAR